MNRLKTDNTDGAEDVKLVNATAVEHKKAKSIGWDWTSLDLFVFRLLLKKLFRYDPDTGDITRLVDRGGRLAGTLAANPTGTRKRYMRVRVNRQGFLAHRIIWLMVTGSWPDNIDHINGKGTDNRWENLRDVDFQENQRNKALNKNNISGHIGVNRYQKNGKYRASICVNYKAIHLGLFDTEKQAIRARKAAEKKYGFHENHGRMRLSGERT